MSSLAGERSRKADQVFMERVGETATARFEPLPEGAFKEAGTHVRTKLLIVTAPRCAEPADSLPPPSHNDEPIEAQVASIRCLVCATHPATHLTPFEVATQSWEARQATAQERPRYCEGCAEGHAHAYTIMAARKKK